MPKFVHSRLELGLGQRFTTFSNNNIFYFLFSFPLENNYHLEWTFKSRVYMPNQSFMNLTDWRMVNDRTWLLIHRNLRSYKGFLPITFGTNKNTFSELAIRPGR